ncbi:MAG: hypothetical protein ACYTF1_14565 [Planctomycetota bacterium]
MNGTFTKQIYHTVALVGSITFFSVAGLLGYLLAAGKLNGERIDQMAMVLRGEFPTDRLAVAAPEAPKPSVQPSFADRQAMKEYYLLCSERNKRELADSRALNQSIRLQIDRLMQELKDQQQQFEREKEAFYSARKQAGFDKTLEMISSIDPVKARNILMQKDKFEQGQVVQLMMAMSERKAKKIINACRSPEEVTWAGKILAEIHNLNNQSPAGGEDRSAGSAER